MVLSKQFWEPYKWMVKAQQSALNKASSVAHIGAEALTGKQWVSGPGSYAPPIEDFPSHFGKKFLPIWGQQMTQDGIGSGLSSAMGFPIKGQPGGLEALGRSSGSR